MVLTSVESLEPDRAPIGRDAVTAVPAASGHSASDRFDRRSGANVQIRLLGGIRAETADGEVVDVGPAKSQALLAALALSPGAAVPVARLVDLVWGDEPPRTAEKTLQTYVGRLRQGLGQDALARVGVAYRLNIGPEGVDVGRFQSWLAAGDVDAALAEWTGEPLAGLEAPGLRGVVDGLVEQWIEATERSLAAAVERDPAATIPRLTELTNTHPFREGLWALLMTALYRAGRQADALAAFARARSHLVEELGVEPGPALRSLEAKILGQDENLDARPVARQAPTGTVTFAFSDIEGSSMLWAQHRQPMAAAVARHDEIIRACVAAHRGYVFATGGDSFGVAFHRANDAIVWAAEVQDLIDAEDWPSKAPIRVRIGMHTGEADERGGDYYGPAVNTAARVADSGHGGQVVVTAVTAALLDRSDLVDLGSYRLDGVPGDTRIHQLAGRIHPPLRTAETRRGNLPQRLGRLHGRDDELDAVVEALKDHPLVTLVGPGGIGKTRLAIAAARTAAAELRDSAWLVELADVSSVDDVALAVLDAVDGRRRTDRSTEEAVVAHLRSLETLVVLDNCEHVIEGAADLATTITRSCPNVRVLVTSREGLAVADERLIAVGPLDHAGAAVELFMERALAADPDFRVHAEQAAAEEICGRLDGVPLAIEIAAARLRTLSTGDLISRLDDRLRVLTSGRRRSIERHRTLRATIQWSYDLLTVAERIVLRRLSVFAGGFDLAAAETVVGDELVPPAEVAAVIGDLVDRSMVTVDSGAVGRRYRLMETVRQFAAELLADEGDTERLAARHARAVRDEVARLGDMLMSNSEVEGAARLAELWPNLRAAVDWATAADDHRLLTDLLRPVALQAFIRRGLTEMLDWIERLLAMVPAEDADTVGEALIWAALPYSMTQRRERFRSLLETYGDPANLFVRYARLIDVDDDDFRSLVEGPAVVAEFRARGQESIARLFEMFIGAAMLNAGRLDESQERLATMAAVFRVDGPPSFLNWTLFLQGAAAAFAGDDERAEAYWAEIAEVVVPPRTNSPIETLAARNEYRQGRPREAARILDRYMDDLLEDDNMAGVGMVGIEYVNMMVGLGRLHAAAELLGHFDTTGLLDVEGPGFRILIEDAILAVAADPEAAAIRSGVAAAGDMDERAAIGVMRSGLAAFLTADADQSSEP